MQNNLEYLISIYHNEGNVFEAMHLLIQERSNKLLFLNLLEAGCTDYLQYADSSIKQICNCANPKQALEQAIFKNTASALTDELAENRKQRLQK